MNPLLTVVGPLITPPFFIDIIVMGPLFTPPYIHRYYSVVGPYTNLSYHHNDSMIIRWWAHREGWAPLSLPLILRNKCISLKYGELKQYICQSPGEHKRYFRKNTKLWQISFISEKLPINLKIS